MQNFFSFAEFFSKGEGIAAPAQISRRGGGLRESAAGIVPCRFVVSTYLIKSGLCTIICISLLKYFFSNRFSLQVIAGKVK